MMAGGIVALCLGTPIAAIGGALAAGCGEGCENKGAGVLVVGLALMAGGITLTVIGAKKVPVDNTAKTTLVPSVGIGPGSASLRWTF